MTITIHKRKFLPNKIMVRGNTIFIKLNRNGKFKKSAMIDFNDYYKVSIYRWILSSDNYVTSTGRDNIKKVYLHHLILGKPKKGLEIDHINENPLDNRKVNLRVVNRSINNLNRKGTKGCWYRKDTKKWAAEIKVDGKKISLGCFNTYKEAKTKRDMAKLKIISDWEERAGLEENKLIELGYRK